MTLEYFFSLVSPWSYLGHVQFEQIASNHRATILYKPAQLGTIFAASGGLPLGKRHPLRQDYRLVELQRWRVARGKPMNIHPKFWPFDVTLADRTMIVLADRGAAAGAFAARAFTSTFEREENMADETVIAVHLSALGLAPQAIIEAAKSSETESIYAANTALALERGVMGAPAYVRDGEVFWGQDRLDLLAAALKSGRAPFTPAI